MFDIPLYRSVQPTERLLDQGADQAGETRLSHWLTHQGASGRVTATKGPLTVVAGAVPGGSI
jgi:hypothetical protein